MHRAVRARRRAVGLAIVIVGALVATTAGVLPAQAADPTNIQVSAPVRDASTAQLDYGDIAPAIIDDNGTVYVINSDGHNALDPDTDQLTWHRFSGPSMDDLTQLPDANNSAFVKQAPGDNDMYWLTGIWKDTSAPAGQDVWYATVHVEYDYTGPSTAYSHQRRIMLAESTNQGATWTNLGNILTADTDPTLSSGQSEFGPGDQRLVVDTAGGYFYLFYWVGYTDAYGWWNHENVARCPIASKMAPGCWKKWYDGSFSQPGLGGHDGEIMSFTNQTEDPSTGAPTYDTYSYSDVPAFSYNTYLHEWIAIGHDWMASATNLNTENWTGREYFPTTPKCNYPFTWDPSTNDQSTTSATFRLYEFGFTADCGPNATRYYNVNLDPSGVYTPTSWQASTESYWGMATPWRYQYTTDGGASYSPLPYNSAQGQWLSPVDQYCTVFSATQQHPGSPGANACSSSRTFVAPGPQTGATITANGPVTVAASCNGNTSGVELRIMQNGTQIWPAAGTQVDVPNAGTYTFPSGVTANLAVGDQLHFLVTALGTSNACDATTWDPVVGTPSLPNTSWEAALGYSQAVYQWQEDYTTDGGATYQPMTLTAASPDPSWDGSEAYCTVFDSYQQHPGATDCSSARTWIAPDPESVSIGAFGPITVAASCGGNTSGVDIKVMLNSTQIWPASGTQNIPNGGSFTFPSGLTAAVNTGDQIHFVVTAGSSNNECDSTTWDQTVSAS